MPFSDSAPSFYIEYTKVKQKMGNSKFILFRQSPKLLRTQHMSEIKRHDTDTTSAHTKQAV